ncbi:S8 family peptidase [Geobacter sp. FeAm09]|uniref:S8 family peptidase n=1 Tax=Geobacter sp. FeAm09 TaxID=2597769 RepID=UPI0011ECD0FB|nr:S8 family peptidase [Geobacter sp. FeAm09]QEM67206.1 S8 family peptidase [Geobacter sp. FeAm09]
MPPRTDFGHLPLPYILSDRAFLQGRGQVPAELEHNRHNFQQHGFRLAQSARTVTGFWNERNDYRQAHRLPVLPSGIPVLLRVEPDTDLDFLRSSFGFEIVSEQEEGFVIVASEEINLNRFIEAVESFARNEARTGNAAKVYDFIEDQTCESRLRLLLSEQLMENWFQIDDHLEYVIDFGIECAGTITLSELKPKQEGESDEQYDAKRQRWERKRAEVYENWDELRLERETQFIRIVEDHAGEVLGMVDGEADYIPDSFTIRVRISGLGLKDLVLNYPFLFEVTEPDSLQNEVPCASESLPNLELEIIPPNDDSPYVCVIDSGIQEEHPLLKDAIDGASSECFIPGESPTDTADYVREGGHGTRVAGAVLYPNGIPRRTAYQQPCRIRNARVLDHNNSLIEQIFPPALISQVVNQYSSLQPATKIFNHSISGFAPCRLLHMSAWAAQIDLLSYNRDVLIIQSAGNLRNSYPGPVRYGILDHISAGRPYPDYLLQDSCRIPNPSQSLQVLTVGSVAQENINTPDLVSIDSAEMPSAFTTTGLGIWGSIKPEVVEYGGGMVLDGGYPPSISTPPEVCPELVRSTYPHGGPLYSRDCVGTSFSAPKVAHIAASIETIFPNEPALLYRALIVNSARWPRWAENHRNPLAVIRKIGYGIPNLDRATTNSPYRVTLITAGERRIRAREAQIYRVPIPVELRNIIEEHDIRIDVTLSYAAKPKRTRRNIKNYLSTWVDWKSSKVGETFDSFSNRVLLEGVRGYNDGEGEIPWMLRERGDWGTVQGIKRGVGTVQKDWAVVKSNRLPEDFCIAVVGHPGWDKDADASAKYSLVVSFDAVERDIEIYSQIQVAVEAVIETEEIQVEV